MGFNRRRLQPGEEVLVEARFHPGDLVLPSLVTAVLLGGAVAARDLGAPERYPMLGALALALGASLWLAARYARWATSSVVVTTARVVTRRGVLARRWREVRLDRVTDAGVDQSLAGRLVGRGDLVVEGREGVLLVAAGVARPHRLAGEVLDAAAAARPAGTGLTVPEQLEKLDELRRRGVISAAEFGAKRAKLLERL